jgi:hypothetical protein
MKADDPFELLKYCIEKLPATVLLLIFPAVAATLSITRGFVPDLLVYISILVLILIVTPVTITVFQELLVFGLLPTLRPTTSLEERIFRVFSYCFVMGSAVCLFTSVFFGWPIDLHGFIIQHLIRSERTGS